MRIVSLCPSITETLVALGCGPQLVGITRFCIHPAEVVSDLPKVGGTKDPKLERIVDAAPDLVLMDQEENRKEDFAALEAAGLRVESTLTRGVAQVPARLRQLGAWVGAEVRAEDFAVRLEAGLEALEGLRTNRERAFRYAYLIWKKPWMAVGPDTYVSDLFALAGGVNVVPEGPARYPEVRLEDLRAAGPDVILLPDEPFPFDARHLPELQAELPDARLELISGDDACWHGVRSLRGVTLAARFAREVFTPPGGC